MYVENVEIVYECDVSLSVLYIYYYSSDDNFDARRITLCLSLSFFFVVCDSTDGNMTAIKLMTAMMQ